MNDKSGSAVVAAIVLAAGDGTRMKSTTPKVLHEICGRSMLGHVVAAARGVEPDDLVVVTGRSRNAVDEHLAQLDPGALPVFQATPSGTGHAVRVALQALDASATAQGRTAAEGTVVVVPGDTPLLSAASLAYIARVRGETSAAAVVLTARPPDPTGYGRVVRSELGYVQRIVEHADADEAERLLTEINAGVYAFDADALRHALAHLTSENAQREEYLPDVVRLMVESGQRVEAVMVDDWHEVAGVNDQAQLAVARALLRDRLVEGLMLEGVSVFDPLTTWIDIDVVVEPEAVLWPNTVLVGRTHIGAAAHVGPNCHLRDTAVGSGAVVRDATCDGADIGPDASVGPYTYLRPGTRLGRGAKAGGFVEMKNAVVGDASKVPHLSYVGDATIGTRSNVGAATVFVNYDGVAKHSTVVGDDVRIGSDTMLVAPVTIGDGAYTAAGSVVTDDVPPGALAVGRARQRTIDGWVAKRRPGSASAISAARAVAGSSHVSADGAIADTRSADDSQGDAS